MRSVASGNLPILLLLSILFPMLNGCREPQAAPAPSGSPPAEGTPPQPVGPPPETADLGQLAPNHLYPNNRPPLLATPFSRLPPGAIRARGWLLTQLRLLADGLAIRLPEIDENFSERSAWLGGNGEAGELGPGYFRGLTALAYSLGDRELIGKARRWLEWSITHQGADGWIGPEALRRGMDWRPNMVVLDAWMEHHAATGDARIIEGMRRYFAFQRAHIEERPLQDRARARGGDNVEAIYWLYNRTGDAELLDLADILVSQTHDYTADYLGARAPDRSDLAADHAAGFRQPAIRYQATKDLAHIEAIERGWKKTQEQHGRVDGMFSGDDALHGSGSQRGADLCAIIESISSLAAIQRIVGAPHWSDWLERIVYNALPGASTPDLRGFLCYSQQNQVQCTRGNHGFHADHQDDLTFGPQGGSPCCRANFHLGWPRFAASLWMAGPGDGLAAMAYAPCELAALVGEDEGVRVGVEVETDYPFDDRILIKLHPARPILFPLALRIPVWCEQASARVNLSAPSAGAPGSYLTLLREWREGDEVALQLPMPLAASSWTRSAAGIEMGPLVFALPIEGEWKRFGGPEGFPAAELLPRSPWNYALRLDPNQAGKFFELERRPREQSIAWQPFDPARAPLRLVARGRRVPAWTVVENSAGDPPASPVPASQLDAQTAELGLIPYGAAKLRIALFPWYAPE